MFQRILLPLDGSELSEMTIPYGEELASKLDCEVILYHVHGHEHSTQEHMHQMYLEMVAEIMQRKVRNNMASGAVLKIST